jgi:hypothetical protein
MQQWNFKAIDVINGHVRRRHEKADAMRQGMELMRQGHIVTKPLATSYNLADTDLAFQDLARGATGLFKAALSLETGG